jgi:hypothetical protein
MLGNNILVDRGQNQGKSEITNLKLEIKSNDPKLKYKKVTVSTSRFWSL